MDFKSSFLTQHLITYIGNKRRLLKFIDGAMTAVKQQLGTENPSIFDGFSGSGSTSRLFKHYASALWVNDLENYCETINKCYLANRSEVPDGISDVLEYLEGHKLDPTEPGYIARHYAPQDDENIKEGERVFYTNRNAKIIDNTRRMIFEQDETLRPFLLAPLLVEASIHANTSGVFKGFHKKGKVGHFGGAGEHALTRIKGEIELHHPVWCEHECPTHIFKHDANKVVEEIPEVDIAYYDPPYNQHPYGSNYFMLNIINDYDGKPIQDGVSGISVDWNKSMYNKRKEAEAALEHLIANTKAKYVLISYNNEGTIPIETFATILDKFGQLDVKIEDYTTYRGSKNTGKQKTLKDGSSRSLKVFELLWILKVR